MRIAVRKDCNRLKGDSYWAITTQQQRSSNKPHSKHIVCFFKDKLIDQCDTANIVDILRKSSDIAKLKNTYFLRSHLPTIATRLATISSLGATWSGEDIAIICYGMRFAKPTDDGVAGILSAMAAAVTQRLALGLKFQSRHAAWLAIGLSGSGFDNEVHGKYLLALAGIIRNCPRSFEYQTVGNILYGLRGMSCNHTEVRDVISAVAFRIPQCQGALDSKVVGISIYGLKGMSSDHPEVRDFLRALAIRIREHSSILDSQAIGNSIFGM